MTNASIIIENEIFEPRGRSIILEFRGHPNTVMQYILKILGLETEIYFTVTRKNIQYRFSNLSGETTITCPLDSVTGMVGGITRPMWALKYGAIVALLGFAMISSSLGMLIFIIGLAMLGYFVISKELYIGFSTADFTEVVGLGFDGGKLVDHAELLKRVEHINRVILKVHDRQLSGQTSSLTTSELQAIEVDVLNTLEEEQPISTPTPEPESPIEESVVDHSMSEASIDQDEDSMDYNQIPDNYFDEFGEDEDDIPDNYFDDFEFDEEEPIEIPPISVTDLVQIGREHYKDANYADALEIAEQAHSQDKANRDVIQLLAESHFKLDNKTEAYRYRDLWHSLK